VQDVGFLDSPRRVIFSDTSIAATQRLALPGGYGQYEASGKLVLE